MQAAGGKSTL